MIDRSRGAMIFSIWRGIFAIHSAFPKPGRLALTLIPDEGLRSGWLDRDIESLSNRFVVRTLTFMLGWFHRKNGAYDKERFVRTTRHLGVECARTHESFGRVQGG